MTLLLLLSLAFQDAAALVEKLRSETIEERDEAMRQLRAMGRAAAPVIEKASKDDDAEVVARARRLLRIFELEEAAPASLRKALPGIADRLAEDDTAWTRAFLLTVKMSWPHDALGFLAPGALRGARTLQELEQICDWIAEEKLQSTLPELLRLLRSPDERAAYFAVEATLHLDSARTVPHVVPLLDPGEHKEVRIRALDTLRGLRGESGLTEIARLSDDRDSEIRRNAVHTLAQLGTRKAIPELLRFLKDGEQGVRFQAVVSLDLLQAHEAVPDLIRYLAAEKDPDVREEAAKGLSRWGGAEAIPELRRLLKDPAHQVRSTAALALGNADDRASTAGLSALLADKNPRVANAAAWSLCRLGSREGVPLWIEAARKFQRPFGALNAVRRPAEWRRLREKAGRFDPTKPKDELMKQFKGAVALSVEGDLTEENVRGRLAMRVMEQRRPVRLLEALELLQEEDRLEFVLEADRVRILPAEAAEKFWADWWAAEAARKN